MSKAIFIEAGGILYVKQRSKRELTRPGYFILAIMNL